MAKHQRCKQTVEHSSFLFDSFRGLMPCLDEQLSLLRSHPADLRFPDLSRSMRDLERVKGLLLHYSSAIRHLLFRITEMQCPMGPVANAARFEGVEGGDAPRESPFARTSSAFYDRPGGPRRSRR